MGRTGTCRRLAAVAAVAMATLAACSGGDGVRALGPVPTAPSTTAAPEPTAPTTTSTTAGTATTTRPPATTSTTARPRLVDGIPQVTATPSRGPVGTRVRIEGTGFTEEMWKASGASLWLVGPDGCGAYAEARHTVSVSAGGRLSGEFVVPTSGSCRQSTVEDVVLRSGVHRIAFACTACTIGRFEVTGTTAACSDIGFTPNSEDMASDVVAFNLSCAEAEALVRKVGPRLGAVGGPSRVEVDGFACVRTAQDDGARGIPSSDFECTSAAKKVTFRRT